jgi:hypothetical protein
VAVALANRIQSDPDHLDAEIFKSARNLLKAVVVQQEVTSSKKDRERKESGSNTTIPF